MTVLNCTPQILTRAEGGVRRLHWDTAAIGLIVGLMLFYYTGIIASDDLGYLLVWKKPPGTLPDGQLSPAWYYACRFVHWLPLKLLTALPPRHPWMMGAPSLLGSIGLLFIIRSIARRRLGLSEGATAVCLLTFGLMPTMVVSASVALPDLTATVLAWLGVSFAAPALLDEDRRRPVLECLAGGFLIALAYNAKETTLALIPGCILFVALCRTRRGWAWKRCAWLAAGAVLWIGIETAILWALTGHPLARMESVRIAHAVSHKPDVQFTPIGLLSYWTDYLRWLADPRSDFGVTGPLMLAGTLFVCVRRTLASSFLLLLVVPAAFYLSVGSTEWKHYAPVFHQSRYFLPVLPALALLAGLAFQDLRRTRLGSSRWANLAIAAVLLAALPGPNRLAGRWSHAQCFAAGYGLVSDFSPLHAPAARLVASGLTRNRFDALPRWLDCPKLEVALPAPVTPDEWVARYAGAYVLTTRFDRLGDGSAKHDHLTLYGASMDALSRFECTARREPDRDRLSSLQARILGRPAPSVPGLAVELWRVPTPAEYAQALSISR